MDLCKHNQTGFCKFRNKCQKRHENTVCENTENCSEERCTKRHPKVCRDFNNNKNCRHKDKCAYKHIQHEKQTELNELIKQGLLKHENDIKLLTEEVNKLRNLVQYMALELSKNAQKEVPVVETNENTVTNKETEASPSDPSFKGDKCEFSGGTLIMLNKHKNTKHIEQKLKTDNGKKHGNKDNFYCDECHLSFTKKKDLKKHKEIGHKNKENSNEPENTNGHENTTPKIQEAACKCTAETVCDYCLKTDGWVY